MTQSPHILIVDDHREIRDLVSRALSKEGFRVSTAAEGRAMRKILADSRIDLILLDLMLPGESGLALTRELRAQSATPIIMVTAKGEEIDRVIGLELGADDYLPKPFGTRELVARINAVLRRTRDETTHSVKGEQSKRFAFDRWTLNADARELVRDDGVVVALSTTEFDLLMAMVTRSQRVLSRETLLDLVKGRAASAFDRSIDTQVSRLRKKIELDASDPKIIQTVWGGRLHICRPSPPNMKSPFPRTLFGQTVLVLITGIGLALLAGILIWASDRKEAVRIVGALALAERIVNVSRLVGDTPESWRSRLVNGASDPHFQVVLSESKPDITTSSVGPGSIIADFIRQALIDRTVDVSISQALSAQDGWMPGAGRGSGGMGFGRMGQGSSMHAPMMHGPLAHSGMSWSSLEAAVQLVDGKWLRFSTSLPDQGPAVSIRLILALGMIAVAIVLLSAWAVRRMTIPLDTLASAAIRLGRNVDTPSLDVKGTIEMRRAAEAFNDMQTRLRHLIENRTVMLAAISHDLRTKLTLLRLRAENADAGDDRDKMLNTISEMEDMLMATLSFAREEARNEDVRRVDVSALLASIADDMADAGLPVSQGPLATGVILDCKPTALRRAFTNLIDNAVKYGGSAKVGLSVEDHSVSIVVEDQGPGISADQIGLVTQPFYRIERSRNRESGGIGLGLAIVVSIVEAHGGCLKLSNRSGGGLSARVELPKGQLL